MSGPDAGEGGWERGGGRRAASAPALPAPLAGVRVLHLGWVWVGGTVSQLLADFGAEVIKVESRSRVDLMRRAGPSGDGSRDPDAIVGFHTFYRNARSLSLDLARPEATALVRRLAALSDVVVENFSPRYLPRLGL